MVNIRCTFADAQQQGLLSERSRVVVERAAKALPYAERTYDRILKEAAAAGLDGRDVEVVRAWLPSGRRDLKREDAVRMLQAVGQRLSGGTARVAPKFHFEETTLWLSAVKGTLEGTRAPRT
jgi:hypothetical protein